jgi:transcriptional accessory protein Tex/SPT6
VVEEIQTIQTVNGTTSANGAGRTDDALPRSLEALRPRMGFTGKVTRVELGGVFVDIGVGVDGFLHVSQIVSDKPILRVADLFRVGDEITVYIQRVQPERKRIDLTMHKPPAYYWDNLQIGTKLHNVRVVSVESFGVFVDFDGPKHGLIPFNLMPKGVRPKVGEQIDTVWVVEVDESKRRIGLTMIEPPALPWEKIKKGDVYTGKVTRVERNAAYVDIGGRARRRRAPVIAGRQPRRYAHLRHRWRRGQGARVESRTKQASVGPHPRRLQSQGLRTLFRAFR